MSKALKGLNWQLFLIMAQSSHAGPQHASHSRFHPGAFPGMFKSALCVCVPSGHFKIAQNIQSAETGNPPSLTLPVSAFSWVGTGALLTSGKRMQEAFQMPAPSLGVQQGHLLGKKVASHPSGPGPSLDSKKFTGPCLLPKREQIPLEYHSIQ